MDERLIVEHNKYLDDFLQQGPSDNDDEVLLTI